MLRTSVYFPCGVTCRVCYRCIIIYIRIEKRVVATRRGGGLKRGGGVGGGRDGATLHRTRRAASASVVIARGMVAVVRCLFRVGSRDVVSSGR